MATKAQVRAALKRAGGTWDEAYDTFDAPTGYRWQASQTHGMAAAYDPDQLTSENYAGFIEEIDGGVYLCADAECDTCLGY